MSKYKGIKSTVKKPKSAAAKSADERKLRQTRAARGAAKKSKYVGLAKSQVPSTSASKAPRKRPLKLMPMKGNHLVKQLPETDLTIKGKTLKQLLRTTPSSIMASSTEIVITKYKKTKTQTGRPAVVITCYHKDPFRPEAVKRYHEVTIIGRDVDLKIGSPKQKVVASCDCENYVYTWEYANAKHGASQLIFGNGEKPTFTNPGEVPGLCKHCSAAAKAIISKGH